MTELLMQFCLGMLKEFSIFGFFIELIRPVIELKEVKLNKVHVRIIKARRGYQDRENHAI